MIDFILHLNVHLGHLVASLGPWIYALLFAVIFAETGLVILPFLPGDSLLFAIGALAALPDSHLHIAVVILVMYVGAICGDSTNYFIGSVFGERIMARPRPLIKPAHLARTQLFYQRHGGKTILLCRFVPIVRTVAPFVAGLAKMKYRKFASFSVSGSLAWIMSIALGGYLFGNLPTVQSNFHLVILAIVAISFLPIVLEYAKTKKSVV